MRADPDAKDVRDDWRQPVKLRATGLSMSRSAGKLGITRAGHWPTP